MPLWSNEEWRARIGSSWCALGRPIKRNSSVTHQGIVLGYLQLRVSAGAILRYGLLMMVMAIIAGCGILVSWSLRCGRAIKGKFHLTTTCVKILITIILLLQAIAAVQTSLLMRSGDVERNPGPGRYTDLDYSSVDNSTELCEDDFSDVYREVHTLTTNYYNLGIVLGLPVQEMKKIKKGCAQDLDDAYTEMLLVWLKHSYKVERYGPPTWRRLVEVVDDPAGGNNHALAKKIASNHPTEPTTCDVPSSQTQTTPNAPQDAEPDSVFTLPSSTKEGDSKMRLTSEDTDNPNAEPIASGVSSRTHSTPNIGTLGKSRTSLTLPSMTQPVLKTRTMSCVVEDIPKPEDNGGWIIQKNRDTMATYYIRQVDDRAWPPVKKTNFINLALIKEKSSWRRTFSGPVDEIVSEGDTTSYSTILNDIETERFVLFEGRPGSGKTTLMNKISRDWARREILTPYLVVLVPLRRLNNETDRNILTILRIACPGLPVHDLEQLAGHIEQHQGEGVVFAFDGLDEYVPYFYDPVTKLKEELTHGTKKPLRRQLTAFFATGKKKTIDDIFQIMYGKSLTKALVIVSSRPSACTEFREYAKKRIEVLGFLKAQIVDYIYHCFDCDEDKAKQLILHLERYPNLMNMAYLPLHCAMLAFLYQEDTLLPETETEFYKFFTISTLLRDIRKRQGGINISLMSFDDLSDSDRVIFDKICELAFNATVKSKQVFTASDVKSLSTYTTDDQGTLGLVVIDHCFTRYGLDDTYTFLHLTFQEYLAAVHITGLTKSQQMELIRNHRKDKHLSVVWKFLCGMIDLTSTSAMDIFKSLMETSAAKDKLVQIQCCHESQNSLPCTHVISASKGQLKFTSSNLTPSDCAAIGYVISESDDEKVKLVFNDCNFSTEAAVALLQKVEDHPMSITLKKGTAVNSLLKALTLCAAPGLHYLLLSGSNIGDAGAELLGEGLKKCTNIIRLDLSDNKISADGAEDLAEGLEYCAELKELDLSNNSLADQGMVALSKAIKDMDNLQELCLNKNLIGSEGVEALSEALETLTALQLLSLNKNSIDDNGAKALSQAMEEMTSLQQLHLNFNYIGEDGQEAISAAAKQKRIKIKLNNQYRGL